MDVSLYSQGNSAKLLTSFFLEADLIHSCGALSIVVSPSGLAFFITS